MADPSLEVQAAILARLVADPDVTAIVQGRVIDGLEDGLPPTIPAITLGDSTMERETYECVVTRVDTLDLHAWAGTNGRRGPVKALLGAMVDAIMGTPLTLATHAVANVYVEGMRVFLDADGLTGHGVLTLTVETEEA